jgi:molybdate transport system substrate-binding protein
MLRVRYVALAFAIAVVLSGAARAEPLKVLTAGAFKQVLLAVIPQFEASGRKVKWETGTVGNIINRIETGESFDLVIASPAALSALGKSGKLEGGIDLAKVGVGMAIREGAAKPDIGSVDAFKQALLAAKGVAYVDPAAGGSSGIYVSGLIDRLGIGAEVRRKAVLVQGGAAADRVASGEADIALQQISEILPVKGTVLAGPLPSEIQNYTIYSAAIAAGSGEKPSAQALIDLVRSSAGAVAIKSTGMEPIDQNPPAK